MSSIISGLPAAVSYGLIWAIVALGIFITYKVLDFADLTVDGSLATGGAVCALVIVNGGGLWFGLVAGVVAGLLCGLITGLLHTFLGIPPILAGILTQLVLWSVNFKLLGGSFVFISNRTHAVFASIGNPLDAMWKMAIVVGILVLGLYVFFGTQLGASIRATGNNQRMARAQGINTKFNIVLGLMLSNGIVALGGAFLAQFVGRAATDLGVGAIVTGLCSIVIGLAITKHISPNFLVRMVGVILGAIIYNVIFHSIAAIRINNKKIFDDDFLKMLAAIVVVLFLGVPYLYNKYKSKFVRGRKNKKLTKEGE